MQLLTLIVLLKREEATNPNYEERISGKLPKDVDFLRLFSFNKKTTQRCLKGFGAHILPHFQELVCHHLKQPERLFLPQLEESE